MLTSSRVIPSDPLQDALVQRAGAPEAPFKRSAQMVPLHNASMMGSSGDRGAFLEMLRRNGYADMRPSDADLCTSICKHESEKTVYVHNIPGTMCFPDGSLETLADIGWEVMTGCRGCMVSLSQRAPSRGARPWAADL